MFNNEDEDKDLGFGGDFSDGDDDADLPDLDLGDDLDIGLEDPEEGFGDKDEY